MKKVKVQIRTTTTKGQTFTTTLSENDILDMFEKYLEAQEVKWQSLQIENVEVLND